MHDAARQGRPPHVEVRIGTKWLGGDHYQAKSNHEKRRPEVRKAQFREDNLAKNHELQPNAELYHCHRWTEQYNPHCIRSVHWNQFRHEMCHHKGEDAVATLWTCTDHGQGITLCNWRNCRHDASYGHASCPNGIEWMFQIQPKKCIMDHLAWTSNWKALPYPDCHRE